MRRFLIGCRLLRALCHSVNNYKCVIDMHTILVRVDCSIQNSCVKYSAQNQHFATMFTLIEISFIRQYVSDGIFACRAQRPLSTKYLEFALSVAVVDTRSLAGARNHYEGSASYTKLMNFFELPTIITRQILPVSGVQYLFMLQSTAGFPW
jgi:hypothetical protein